MMHVAGSAAVTPVQAGWNSSGSAHQPPLGTIPLHTVIDYMLQKTYHDIVVLADLLPGKSDLERKIDIAHFANRTRQLAIRLLTVVKWAGSVSKVMKCEVITQLLDQQALLFVDTADKLHTLANQFVVQARLPNFTIPAAIDVLTTGTYPRLPKAIRDKVIPPDPVTALEKSITLKRLNEIITHKLAVTKIPLQITDVKVEKGMVRLTVPGEFKAILTLMGQSDDIPWRLLKIDIGVQDKYISGGTALVHRLQVDYIHELVQSRLLLNEDPLEDLYKVLHSFCISLKIEVLEAQAIRLLRQRWGRLIQIDEYQPGSRVVLSYWRPSKFKTLKSDHMTIAVHQEQKDESVALVVTHKPPLVLENVQLVENASTIKDMSLERLLGDTILVRSYHKLHDLRQILRKHVKKDTSSIATAQSCLIIPLAKPYQSCGKLYVSVDPQTGTYSCASTDVAQDILDEIEQSINESSMNIVSWIPKLKMVLAKENCKSTVQGLPAFCVETLSLVNSATHPIGKLGDNLIFIKLTHFDQYYVIVQIVDDDEDSSLVSFRYFLLRVLPDVSSRQSYDKKADVLMELNSSLLEDFDNADNADFSGLPNYQNSELALIISVCNSRIPFISLTHDLRSEDLMHQGLLVDAEVGLCVKVLNLGDLSTGVASPKKSVLVSNTVQCSFKLLEKAPRITDCTGLKVWHVELIFANNPLKVESKQGSLTRIMVKLDSASSDSPMKAFKELWSSIIKLHEIVDDFAEVLYDQESSLGSIVSVHSYDYQTVTLKYGAQKQFVVTIRWSHQVEGFLLQFARLGSAGFNSHSYISHYLNSYFNANLDIGKLIKVLHDTIDPLQAACSISSVPVVGMAAGQANTKIVYDNFSILVVNPWKFSMVYRSTFAIDVLCLPHNRVAIKDGSLSKCDLSKVREGLQPIPGLVSFLLMYCKSAVYQGPSVREDPPVVDSQSTTAASLAEGRVISAGNWAGNTPVIVSHNDFISLLKELHINGQSSLSRLEQFMGLNMVKCDIDRITHTQDVYYSPPNIPNNVTPSEIASLQFAVNALLFRCSLQFTGDRLSLTLQVQPVPSYILQDRGLQMENWQADNMRVLEQFFQVRVAAHPYRTNSTTAFCTIISAKSQTLTDFITLMRLELSNHQNDPAVHWLPQLCLSIPPRLAVATPGAPAVYIKDKMLVVVIMVPKNPSGVSSSRSSVVIPIVLHPNGTISTLPARNNNNNPHLPRIDMYLKRYTETRPPTVRNQIASTVKYLMDNYTQQ